MSPSVEPFNEARYKALMDGLECKEVDLSEIFNNKDRRIDSTFYTAKIPYNSNLTYVKIGQYLVSTQYGVSKDMNEGYIGYPIYRMNEIHHMLCDLNPAKSVELSRKEFEKFKLNNGDVLFNRTNSYEFVGRTGIYYYNGVDQTYASYLVRLNPDNDYILSEYLVAFLSSKYGVADIKRRARQSINQTNVNPEEVKEIKIPLICKPLQKLIKECFISANQLRISAADEYDMAESILAHAFDLSLQKEDAITFSVKTLDESFSLTGRLDAEYYQPKYANYIDALKTAYTVQTICSLNDKNFIPDENVEYDYIELANVGNTGDISNVEKFWGKELPSRARRQVKTGQVIVASVEGSLQSCALITEEYNNALCSTGFYVLDSDILNSETLLVLFKSEPIQALLKQRCSGTILTAITKDELLSMPLPQIDVTLQKEIAIKVQESFVQRRKSELFLEYAKRAVEIAIEQDEETAMKWLKEKGVEC